MRVFPSSSWLPEICRLLFISFFFKYYITNHMKQDWPENTLNIRRKMPKPCISSWYSTRVHQSTSFPDDSKYARYSTVITRSAFFSLCPLSNLLEDSFPNKKLRDAQTSNSIRCNGLKRHWGVGGSQPCREKWPPCFLNTGIAHFIVFRFIIFRFNVFRR